MPTETKTMTDINWETTKEEDTQIQSIVERIATLDPEIDQISCAMDITACHLNGCHLDLERMINANDADLLHDIGGINRNLNRDNGKLENHFLPRLRKR